MIYNQFTRTTSKLLNIKYELNIQQVRTWKTHWGTFHSLTVKPEITPDVEPPSGVSMYVYNRNPRNLEKLAIAHKNEGWKLEKDGRTYYHKLVKKINYENNYEHE